MNLNFSHNIEVSKAYIITLRDNAKSERLGARCAESCAKVGQKYEVYDAFDGTGESIKIPEHSKDASWLKWIKQIDKNLSQTEVACALSHISLWAKCVEEDQPLVVLEHDAIMVEPFPTHTIFNAIIYLGSREQKAGWGVYATPPHATNGPNYHFICRAHAYSIDPAVAKNLLAHVIKYGIHESLDIMLRADIFTIVQTGFFAYDEPEGTTIIGRKKAPDGRER
jgi:hypothetical protein